MKLPGTARLAIRVLEYFSPENEALHGDLIEEYFCGRSRCWVWSQVLAAIALSTLRSSSARRAQLESALLNCTMVLLLSFSTVVAANLFYLALGAPAGWQRAPDFWVTPMSSLASFAVALLLGAVIAILHRAHRALAQLSFGASAVVLVALQRIILIPDQQQAMPMPDIGVQLMAAMAVVLGLLVGAKLGERFRTGTTGRTAPALC